jgi:AGZA family xanthine/uracil permease-like MFS transporter
MKNFINNYFKIKERNSDIKTEIISGIIIYLTMAYIIFVEPAVLKIAGMDFGGVLVATCIGSAIICILMGLLANFPIAGAPLMGENFFFVFTIVIAMKFSWHAALTAVFIEGILFLILTLLKLRQIIIDAIPNSLKHAMAVAIGLFIGFIGLKWSGIIVPNSSTGIALGNLKSTPVIIAVFGLIITSSFIIKKVKAALLYGILITTLLCLIFGISKFEGIVSLPPSISSVFMKFDFSFIHNFNFWIIVFLLLYMEIFDTIGTIIGIAEEAGFVKNNKIENAEKILFVDALGTTVGSLLGTSTISSYIESNAGVTQGARTGLSVIITGFLFLISIFFYPLIKMIGGGYEIAPGNIIYPAVGPALIIVGFLMLKNITKIDFSDFSESLPAYFTILGVPLTYSIADGIAFGIISYPVIKLLTGETKKVSIIMYILAIIFIIRYAFFHI